MIYRRWWQRANSEYRRRLETVEQDRVDRLDLNRKWKERQKYIFGERGPWFTKEKRQEFRCMLSDRENKYRMRCKLIENENFDLHENSSRLRDNRKIESSNLEQMDPLKELIHSRGNLKRRDSVYQIQVGEQKLPIENDSLTIHTHETM